MEPVSFTRQPYDRRLLGPFLKPTLFTRAVRENLTEKFGIKNREREGESAKFHGAYVYSMATEGTDEEWE